MEAGDRRGQHGDPDPFPFSSLRLGNDPDLMGSVIEPGRLRLGFSARCHWSWLAMGFCILNFNKSPFLGGGGERKAGIAMPGVPGWEPALYTAMQPWLIIF